MATISMLESRFRIHECEKLLKVYKDQGNSNDKLKVLKKFRISIDHVLKCSVYNQACDGGYSVLVSKFFNEFELYPKDCFDKFSDKCYQSKCKEEEPYKNFNFSVKDYYYVGGSYGKTDAQNLKMEVYKNGPVVVSFEPDLLFMNYMSGIIDYESDSFRKMNIKTPSNSSSNNGKKPEWQKVDHSVVLTGWGREVINGKEIEYWKIQNSWGVGWGENGYFRMRAGANMMSIESIGESGIPIITEI
jgi:cathepsin C